MPQLLEYFHNDKEAVKEFIPKVIEQQCNNLLLEYNEESNNRKDDTNETTK